MDQSHSVLSDPRISEKVRRACAIAQSHGYRYIWIDSCCIDKSSSAELSEAINSMFLWYRDAKICYTFMVDVPSDEDPYLEGSMFSRSAWFKRGWTLQELIAPRVVVFLSQDWTILGTRDTLSKVVEVITGVDEGILAHRQRLDEISVARRMSWAAGRVTTRVEDEAYSLLGIFDINMPTLYGEGQRAFMRLQEEILKRIPDQSIFAWGETCRFPRLRKDASINLPRQASLFAPSPSYFHHSGQVGTVAHGVLAGRLGAHLKVLPLPEYTVSPYGIRTQFPLVSLADSCRIPVAAIPESFHAWYLAVLACDLPTSDLLALICYPDHSRADITLKSGHILSKGSPSATQGSCRLLALSQQDTMKLSELYVETVYIEPVHHSNLPSNISRQQELLPSPVSDIASARLVLAGWSEAELSRRGYRVVYGALAILLCDGKDHIVIAIRQSYPHSDDAVSRMKCMSKCCHSVAVTIPLWPLHKQDYTQERKAFQASDGTPSTVCAALRWLPAIPLLLVEVTITIGGL